MKKLVISFINFYQATFSPLLKLLFGGGCCFSPTCSQYAQSAVEKYGVTKGLALSAQRLLSCHPYGKPI